MMKTRQAFTLVELLVVVGMIAVLMGALSTAIGGAQKRARIQKATTDVKVISQAILGYENFSKDNELPILTRADADANKLSFLIGKDKASSTGEEIPALLMAAFQTGTSILDPWGHPYKVTIRKGAPKIKFTVASQNMQTGYFLPNFYRLGKGERSLWAD